MRRRMSSRHNNGHYYVCLISQKFKSHSWDTHAPRCFWVWERYDVRCCRSFTLSVTNWEEAELVLARLYIHFDLKGERVSQIQCHKWWKASRRRRSNTSYYQFRINLKCRSESRKDVCDLLPMCNLVVRYQTCYELYTVLHRDCS